MVEKLNLVSVINLERQFLIVIIKNVSCITLFKMSICLKNKTKKSNIQLLFFVLSNPVDHWWSVSGSNR